MKPLGCHSSNLNGPVPTGARWSASLLVSSPRGTMAMPVSEASSGAEGSLSFSSSVVASTAVALSIAARRLASGEPTSLETTRRREEATSSASIGLPSWKVTPGRSLKVTVLPSCETVQDWARPGTMLRSLSSAVSPS